MSEPVRLRNQSRGRRDAMVLAMCLLVALACIVPAFIHVPPVRAATPCPTCPTPVTITVHLDGDGTGSWQSTSDGLTTPDGLIDCRRSGGVTSGTCSFTYLTYGGELLSVTFFQAAATGSTTCLSANTCSSSFTGVIRTYNDTDAYGSFYLNDEVVSFSVTGSGSGHVCLNPNTCAPPLLSVTLKYGTNFQVYEEADPGSVFAGWSGACAGLDSTCALKLTTDVTVGAKFVVPLTQTIAFVQPSGGQVGGKPVPLSAVASSGLPVSFTSGSLSICTVSGSTAVPVAPGTCSITAHQAGNLFYLAAPDVTRTFSIAPKATASPFPTHSPSPTPSATRAVSPVPTAGQTPNGGPTPTGAPMPTDLPPPTAIPSGAPAATDSAPLSPLPTASDSPVILASASPSSAASSTEPSASLPPVAVASGGNSTDNGLPWLLIIALVVVLVIGTNIAIFQLIRSRR